MQETNILNGEKAVFYPTPLGLTKGKLEGSSKREMLSISMELTNIPEEHIKVLVIRSLVVSTLNITFFKLYYYYRDGKWQHTFRKEPIAIRIHWILILGSTN